jgi:hypothetical protein
LAATLLLLWLFFAPAGSMEANTKMWVRPRPGERRIMHCQLAAIIVSDTFDVLAHAFVPHVVLNAAMLSIASGVAS